MHYGIIAAGEGSRLVQEGVSKPKPLVEICRQPMIGRLARIFDSCGAESINVIVNKEMTEVRRYLEELKKELKAPLNVKVKSTPSSMHSFAELSEMMPSDGKFVLTTVDTIFNPVEFAGFVRAFEECSDTDALMGVTAHIDDEKPLYVATTMLMQITAFLDEPTPQTKFVSGGIYGLTPEALKVLHHCLEQGVSRMRNFQRRLIEEGLRVRALNMGTILDVDHASDIAKAEAFLGCTAR